MSGVAAVPAAGSALPAGGDDAAHLARVRWALLFGNFVIGCGVMAVVGTLNDISRSLAVSVSVAGQLIAVAAAVMCFGAPLLAGWAGAFDRRKLLVAALVWYAVGHALCALAPSYAALLPIRALTVLGAAVFTPQAAAAIGALAPPEQRGRAITFIFIGWSIASVIGVPTAAFLGDVLGWRSAFIAIAVLGAFAAAWVYATVPGGLRPTALSMAAWKSVLANPVLMAMVGVTALAGAGQFTLFSYFAPYAKLVLGADTAAVTALFVVFGVFGVIGNTLASRHVDRIGAGRAVAFTIGLMALSLLAWPFASTVVVLGIVTVPWALACFSMQSMQQARLNAAAPALAPALMALNTSAIYLGQAAGASSGGWLIAHQGYAPLSWIGFVWLLIALCVSLWVSQAAARRA